MPERDGGEDRVGGEFGCVKEVRVGHRPRGVGRTSVTSKFWLPLPTTATTEDASTPAGSSTVALMVITLPIMAPRAGIVLVMEGPVLSLTKWSATSVCNPILVIGAEGD